MTIGATGGHSNLTQNNFIAQIYSKDVQKFFRRVAVVQDITNTDYFGEIANYGDTVRIIKEPTITIADYTRGLALETQDLVDDEITLTVDQAKYFQFAVDDVEAKVAHHNWTELAIGSAAYTIRDDYDSTILTYMKTNATLNDEIESLCYAALDAEHEVQNAKIGIAGLRKIIINQKNINIFDHDAKCNMNEVMDIIEDHT